MADTPACQACCGAESRHFVHVDDMDLYECVDCGFVYQHPMPSAEEFRQRNSDSYKGATIGYFAKVDSKMRRSRRRMRHLKRMLTPGSGRCFLDVGCNAGFMVEAAREQGFEAWGIDLDPESIAYAREHYPGNHFSTAPSRSSPQATSRSTPSTVPRSSNTSPTPTASSPRSPA